MKKMVLKTVKYSALKLEIQILLLIWVSLRINCIKLLLFSRWYTWTSEKWGHNLSSALLWPKSILNKTFPGMASVISGHPKAIWWVFIWRFESLNYSVKDLKQSSEVFFIITLNQSSYFSWCTGRKSKAANNIVMLKMATTLAQNFKDDYPHCLM